MAWFYAGFFVNIALLVVIPLALAGKDNTQAAEKFFSASK